MHPPCFYNAKEHDEWQEWKRRSREDVTICDDCDKGYPEQMAKEGRCFPVKAVTIYRMQQTKVTLSPITKTVNDSILGGA